MLDCDEMAAGAPARGKTNGSTSAVLAKHTACGPDRELSREALATRRWGSSLPRSIEPGVAVTRACALVSAIAVSAAGCVGTAEIGGPGDAADEFADSAADGAGAPGDRDAGGDAGDPALAADAGDNFAGDTGDGALAADGGDIFDGDAGDATGGDAGGIIEPPVHDPVLFVHGVNGSADNWATMIDRLVADGWDPTTLFAYTFDDPAYGCNVDNADAIAAWVDAIRITTGAARIDIVAHSMGSLSSRYFVKNLGGHDVVGTYATLGGMHRGLLTPCLSPAGLQCTWDELCPLRAFLTQLNADPVVVGPARWVSMYSTADGTVPSARSVLDGAENISFDGVDHDGPTGLLQVVEVYAEVRRVLDYEPL